jgi:hypothetical protein
MPSTVIGSIDYDPEARSLTIRFVPSGRSYRYAGVPPDVYETFRRAFSKGAFFNRHIRDRYPPSPAGEEPASLLPHFSDRS